MWGQNWCLITPTAKFHSLASYTRVAYGWRGIAEALRCFTSFAYRGIPSSLTIKSARSREIERFRLGFWYIMGWYKLSIWNWTVLIIQKGPTVFVQLKRRGTHWRAQLDVSWASFCWRHPLGGKATNYVIKHETASQMTCQIEFE